MFKWFSTSLLLCPVHRFSVGILPGTKLESGPAILHLCNNLLVLARDIPPVIIGQWNLPDLRRYGPVPNGFVFEGGTRCGYCELTEVAVVVVLRHFNHCAVLLSHGEKEWHCHWCFPVWHLASACGSFEPKPNKIRLGLFSKNWHKHLCLCDLIKYDGSSK